MKKTTSQIFVAIVCGLLGFLLAYQFRVLALNNKDKEEYINSEMISEYENLKKANEELTKSNKELSDNLKKIEEEAKSDGNISKELTTQLEAARMQLGTETVNGQGIIITLTPKPSAFTNSQNDISRNITDDEIRHLVNILWFAKAEAISINDYRITSQTGIKNSGNYIWVGTTDKVNPEEKITIKAIGDAPKLKAGITFQDASTYRSLNNYDIDIKQDYDITIDKNNQTIKNDYIKPAK